MDEPLPEPFSVELQRWLDDPTDPKTIGSLAEVFAERTFAVAVLILMLPAATPLPTGGITHVFEAISVAIAAQMVLGRRSLWLPARWKGRGLGSTFTGRTGPSMVRFIHRIERVARPRGAWFLDHGWAQRLCGLVLVGFATSAALAPPFSGLDTLPALGAVLVSLGLIVGDLALVGAGVVVGTGGVVLILTVGEAVVRWVTGLF